MQAVYHRKEHEKLDLCIEIAPQDQGRPCTCACACMHAYACTHAHTKPEIFTYLMLHIHVLPLSDMAYMWSDNKARELATVCLPWQHWTKALWWFDDVDISAFHSCVVVVVVVDLWQSLSEWHLLMSACVLVCHHENVGAWITATNEH